MKPKIVLFLIILFFTAIGIQAQPDCREKFSPYNICNTDYAKADFIFFGEVITLGKIDHDFSINNKKSFAKTTVEVKKTFKGKPNNRIELYLDYDIICQGNPPVGSRQIYNVNKIIINGQIIYYSNYISRPLTDYSPEALKEVFSGMQSVLKNKKENILEGIVQETLDKYRQVELKPEELDKYIFSPTNWKPLSGVLVEATDEQSGKTYSTKSITDGTYRIDNIPPGKYKIQAYLSDGRKVQKGVVTDGSFCQRYQSLILN